ncbi:MAG: ATP-binding protein [Polyangiaceae bacterium]|nr:ATP-binding protein [Polyangiaceae bacterium]
MFVGRAAELSLLAAAHTAPESAFIPVYGRRRVGKSELILKFLEGARGIYVVGKTAPAALQIRELLVEAARVLDEPLLAELPAESWKAALSHVVDRWKGPGKLVVALDEFQWMAHSSPELPGVIQELWDRSWKRSGKVLLILCGSYVGFMEREVLGRQSPLFGRRTAQILLRPFSFREAAALHPRWSLDERARAWFVCGGVPFYLSLLDERRSLEKNLIDALMGEHGALFREPDFLLREELREVESYYAVLLALAAGEDRIPAMARRAGVPERNMHYYLGQLTELGHVARRFPLTRARPAARHVRFRLHDPLLRFWFRFVFPNLSRLSRLGPERAFREVVAPELEAYFGTCFERMCREALGQVYAHEGLSTAFEVGEYWDKQVQLDLVGVRADGWVDLGECKWGKVRSVPALARELEAKVAAYPAPRGATVGRLLFVREKPKGKLDLAPGTRCYSLADLYA